MIRLDPATASPAASPAVPAWALASAGAPSDADAAFQAGAALGALDTLARAQPAWAGAWRQRLALKCAAASMRLAGRAEDDTALRDAWQLCPAGAEPGPAGAIFGAWRQLALQPPAVSSGFTATARCSPTFARRSKNSRHPSARRRSPRR
jgi:hypothetical protein